uniref:G-protein coupled receptors family 1 profile domain-containing protein n=1 Tax=Ditylenchus dipsaci TaxID=166011 RepID=A0A915EEU9_9BILA
MSGHRARPYSPSIPQASTSLFCTDPEDINVPSTSQSAPYIPRWSSSRRKCGLVVVVSLPCCSSVITAQVHQDRYKMHASNRPLPDPDIPSTLCLGLQDVFVALFLILMILMTVLGNVLVVLSVFLYKRMRTFTNFLLTSLATADLLVGLLIMPLSLIDLLHNHNWPFGHLLCSIWATSDVLLCTASILNLCIFHWTGIWPSLRRLNTLDKEQIHGMYIVVLVWGISMVVCSPPWFIPEWNLFYNNEASRMDTGFVCAYSPSVPYRIYSAMVSFYIPLMVMLFVYFKIFGSLNNYHNRCASAPISRIREVQAHPLNNSNNSTSLHYKQHAAAANNCNNVNNNNNHYTHNTSSQQHRPPLCRSETECSVGESISSNNRRNGKESRSLVNLADSFKQALEPDRNTLADDQQMENSTNTQVSILARQTSGEMTPSSKQRVNNQLNCYSNNRLQPVNLLAKAEKHYNNSGPGKAIRGSKEKIVYMRERKALKTIGIVVLGFIVCWMPFFVVYLLEVFLNDVSATYSFKLLNEFFLWLGYSNSVLNPIIYTMYNSDFRRCFRDLLGLGCVQQHRRTMSVKKLHQQSTLF